MISGVRRHATAILTVVLCAAACREAAAQPKTDVVTLANGDRITGEISSLDRGRLEFKTDDAGTLTLEWDKLTSLVTMHQMRIVTTDGSRFLGSLTSPTPKTLTIAGPDTSVALAMAEVTTITPIGKSFWSQIDGSIDAGFSYTKSSGVAQLNLNTDTIYRTSGSQSRLTGSFTETEKSDGTGSDDRGAVEASYQRYPWPRWFVTAVGRFETNKSLGLELRSQVGGAIGPRLVNTNRAQLGIAAGMVFNREDGVDVEPTENVEGLLQFRFSFFTYDRPRTNVDFSTQYYPSLSNLGRHRLQVDAAVRREVWKDLFLAVSMYDTFDSRPPNPDASKNDVGVVASIGWSY
jgi:hypothetical protein